MYCSGCCGSRTDVHEDPCRIGDSTAESTTAIESNCRRQNHRHPEGSTSSHECNWHSDISSKQDRRSLHSRRTSNELKWKDGDSEGKEKSKRTGVETFGHVMTFAMSTNGFRIRGG